MKNSTTQKKSESPQGHSSHKGWSDSPTKSQWERDSKSNTGYRSSWDGDRGKSHTQPGRSEHGIYGADEGYGETSKDEKWDYEQEQLQNQKDNPKTPPQNSPEKAFQRKPSDNRIKTGPNSVK